MGYQYGIVIPMVKRTEARIVSWVEDLELLTDWFTQDELSAALDISKNTPAKWAEGTTPQAPQKRKIMLLTARVRKTLAAVEPLPDD